MTASYAYETNSLADSGIDVSLWRGASTVVLSKDVRIVRLRVIGFGEYNCPVVGISYILGELKDGTKVNVELPSYSFQLNKRTWKSDLIAEFKAAKFFQRNIFQDGTISELR